MRNSVPAWCFGERVEDSLLGRLTAVADGRWRSHSSASSPTDMPGRDATAAVSLPEVRKMRCACTLVTPTVLPDR